MEYDNERVESAQFEMNFEDSNAKKYYEFDCLLCTQIVDVPQCCQDCETVFCTTCIEEWQKISQTCPSCVQPYIKMVSKKFIRAYEDTNFKCPNKCGFMFQGDQLRKHMKSCKNKPLKEIQKVKCKECGIMIRQPDQKRHLENICISKLFKCQHCGTLLHKSMEQNHANDRKCLFLQLEKQNKGKESRTSQVGKKLNIIFVGEMGAGKTTLIKRYIEENYNNGQQSTIGVEVKSKLVPLPNGTIIDVNFWDTSGQEKFRSITNQYFRDKDGVIFVYDILDAQTIKKLENWTIAVDNLASENIAKILIGTKKDQDSEREVSEEFAQHFADSHKIQLYEEVSSMTGDNVQIAINKLIELAYTKNKDSWSFVGMRNSQKLSSYKYRENQNPNRKSKFQRFFKC